jgi:Rieske Fe-S protein
MVWRNLAASRRPVPMIDADRRIVLKAGSARLALGPSARPARTIPSARPKEGDLLIRSGDASRTPLTPGDILGAAQTMAWAMDPGDRTVRSGSRLNQLLLLRVDPETLTALTRTRAADGVIAYTAICTHTGCDIDDWLANEQLLSCPCHFSMFDPKDGGRVVEGPAPRMLPALPLKIVDAKLVVAQSFTAPVEFEKG